MKPFANEPIMELRRAPNRERLTSALAELDATLPLRLGGDGETFDSTDPGKPDRVVAVARRGTEADAADAVARATTAFPSWSFAGAERRAEVLINAAAWLRE